jgi:hypothetical protein
MDYGFSHEGKVFTPNGTSVSPEDNDTRNADIERQQLADWAEQPDCFVAYYAFLTKQQIGRTYRPTFYPLISEEACVTTWLGTRLGDIVSARVYQHNFGSRMVAICVQGTNGAEYYGRASWDNGEVIKLRKVK